MDGDGDVNETRVLEQAPDDETAKEVPARQHHPLLFFEDGNVLLATESWLFCVHKSMLKAYSEVFKDMFTLPQPLNSLTDEELKLPLVPMVGDKDEDIVTLLRTIYERSFYEKYEWTPVTIVLGLLRTSTKYSIDNIQKDVIYQLKLSFPSTISGFDKLRSKVAHPKQPPLHIMGSSGGALLPHESFSLLGLAIETNVDKILPPLFHFCALYDIERIMDAIHLLPDTYASQLLAGRHRLISSFQNSVVNKIFDNEKFTCCGTSIISRLAQASPSWADVPQGAIKFDEQYWKGEVNGKDICYSCQRELLPIFKTIRKEYWELIPKAFGLISASENASFTN